MAQVAIVETAKPASIPLASGLVTWQPGDVGLGNKFTLGDKILLCRNVSPDTPYNLTITAVDDLDGRATNLVIAVGFGTTIRVGQIRNEGWAQATSPAVVYLTVGNAALEFALLTL